MKTPREHGFWVMLFIALLCGVALGRSLASLTLATIVGCGTVFAAMLVGRKIRKNVLLQVAAACLLGVLVLPISMVGECESTRSVLAAATLAVVFSSTTMSVQAILLRARKRFSAARLSAGLALGTAAIFLGLAVAFSFAAAAVATSGAFLLGSVLLVRKPSAKRLRWVGVAVATVQLLSAVALMTLEHSHV